MSSTVRQELKIVYVETRRLAAIMFTDIVGFSRQMGADETRTMRLLNVHNRLIHQARVPLLT
jgi:class 3 adenylate cyclase